MKRDLLVEVVQCDGHCPRIETRIRTKAGDAKLSVWHHSEYAPNHVNSIISEHVDEALSNKGAEEMLLKHAIKLFGEDSLGCQFQSEPWVRAAYKLGFRAIDINTLEETLKNIKATSIYMRYVKPHRKTKKK